MPRLVWSDNALRDVARLHGFLADKGGSAARSAAARAVRAIRLGVKPLGKNPEIGRLLEDSPQDYREWVIEFGRGAYVVRYQIVGNELVISAIRHGREEKY